MFCQWLNTRPQQFLSELIVGDEATCAPITSGAIRRSQQQTKGFCLRCPQQNVNFIKPKRVRKGIINSILKQFN